MAPKRTRGQRDETFQVDPDDAEEEEEPFADDDEDEAERKERQKKADMEGGLKFCALLGFFNIQSSCFDDLAFEGVASGNSSGKQHTVTTAR